MGTTRVFINAPLATLAERQLNEEIARVLTEEGFLYFLPQHVLPPGPRASPERVVETNLKGMEECDIVLSVLDKPGFGVAFELGFALAKGKTVIAWRTDVQGTMGKVAEGLWNDDRYLPLDLKVTSIEELREALRFLRDRRD